VKILFFQHGDFGEAYQRFTSGGPETYRDQRVSVDFVADLRHAHQVTTLAICDRPHHEVLSDNLVTIGIDAKTAYEPAAMKSLLASINPDLIVCRTPHTAVLRWARHRRIPTLPLFADLFGTGGLKQRLKNLILGRLLRADAFPCVANHSLNASRSLATALFQSESRIVPWDWSRLPVHPVAKPAPADPARLQAFFAGMLSEAKGIGDCLEATARLRDRGIWLTFEFAGPGPQEVWQDRAAALGIADRIRFAGRIAHAEVRQRMRDSDLVVVPSRHDYAEGLPNTIYEALASRSPLVMSDHPAFAGRLREGQDCLVFRAADPASLADRIADLAADPGLYTRLSQNAAAAHDTLYVGLEWTRLVRAFLEDPRNATGWVAAHSLSRLRGEGRSR
jgi:glycosyltransferase involved in cell wall biosynthesis